MQLVNSRKYGDYVLRRFTLTKRSVGERKGNQQSRAAENDICREIVQFHMLKWKEYMESGEPPSWLLSFIGKINEYVLDNHPNSQISSSPLLVHCEVSSNPVPPGWQAGCLAAFLFSSNFANFAD